MPNLTIFRLVEILLWLCEFSTVLCWLCCEFSLKSGFRLRSCMDRTCWVWSLQFVSLCAKLGFLVVVIVFTLLSLRVFWLNYIVKYLGCSLIVELEAWGVNSWRKISWLKVIGKRIKCNDLQNYSFLRSLTVTLIRKIKKTNLQNSLLLFVVLSFPFAVQNWMVYYRLWTPGLRWLLCSFLLVKKENYYAPVSSIINDWNLKLIGGTSPFVLVGSSFTLFLLIF